MIPQIKTTKVFADGADLDTIVELVSDPNISGFTTNPTLMRSAGLRDYRTFAHLLLEKVTSHPVSFEVCADDAEEIGRQARVIAGWGENVFVKIPICTSGGEDLTPLAGQLSHSGIKVNVTALFTVDQARLATRALDGGAPSYVSVFAGRIADAGVNPVPIVAEAVRLANDSVGPEVIWASPRQVLNLVEADSVGCHVITMTPDLLKKIGLLGKNLDEFSRDTVEMFFRDAQACGLTV
jgi:transaldolase